MSVPVQDAFKIAFVCNYNISFGLSILNTVSKILKKNKNKIQRHNENPFASVIIQSGLKLFPPSSNIIIKCHWCNACMTSGQQCK